MIFKVSKKRKIFFSLIFSIIGTVILNLKIKVSNSYIALICITIFTIVIFGAFKNKDMYLIENNILTINENKNKIRILINEIKFIERRTSFSGAGYQNGIGVYEIYSIITKDLKYEIDQTMINRDGENLVDILQHSYHKKIKDTFK